MPRHTHPRPRLKHSRAHVRHNRERVIARRWREAKRRHDSPGVTLYRERHYLREASPGELTALRRLTGSPGPVYFVHPELADSLRGNAVAPWLFSRGRGRFARGDPWTWCTCPLCKPDKHDPSRRARERRRWLREAQAELH